MSTPLVDTTKLYTLYLLRDSDIVSTERFVLCTYSQGLSLRLLQRFTQIDKIF